MVSGNQNGEPTTNRSGLSDPATIENAVRTMRSRSPQESLGLSNDSGLFKGFIQATIATVIVVAALTAGPYFYDRAYPPPAKPTKAVNAAKNDTQATPEQGPEPKEAKAPAKKKSDELTKETPKQPPKKDILDVLGESGVKKGTPKFDPFNTKDDLDPK